MTGKNSIGNNIGKYMLMAFIGNAIFGFSFLFSKIAMNVAEPYVLLSVRFAVAFLLLNIIRLAGRIPYDFKGRDLKTLFVLGLYQPVLYFTFESYGIKYTSSSFAGIIIALIPIVGLFFGVFALKEYPTRLQVFFSVLSVSGVLVMSASEGLGAFNIKGFLFLCGAALTGAMFSIHSRSIAKSFTAFERTYVMFGIGTVFFTAIAVVRNWGNPELWIKPLTDKGFLFSIFYLSCISSVGAFLLLNKALNVLDIARSLVFANVTTVISVLAGVLILKEYFTPIQFIGIIMVLVGVYGVNR